MKWKPGESGNPAGRPAGSLNKVRRDIRALALRLVSDELYVNKLRVRLLSGRLAPALELALLHYAHGKPPDRLQVENAPLPPLVVEVRDYADAPPAERTE